MVTRCLHHCIHTSTLGSNLKYTICALFFHNVIDTFLPVHCNTEPKNENELKLATAFTHVKNINFFLCLLLWFGQMISVTALYSNDPSSNLDLLYEKTKNKSKRGRDWSIKNVDYFPNRKT